MPLDYNQIPLVVLSLVLTESQIDFKTSSVHVFYSLKKSHGIYFTIVLNGGFYNDLISKYTYFSLKMSFFLN